MAELNFDRIISLNSDNEKGVSLQIGVYGGYASLTVWDENKKGGPTARFPLNRAALVLLKEHLHKALSGAPKVQNSIPFSKWDRETRTSIQLGGIFVGRDEKALLYFGIQTPKNPPQKFPLRVPITVDSGESLTDVQRSELSARTVIDQLTTDIPVALMITSFKRENTGRPGGSSSGSHDSSIF